MRAGLKRETQAVDIFVGRVASTGEGLFTATPSFLGEGRNVRNIVVAVVGSILSEPFCCFSRPPRSRFLVVT